MPYCVNCGNLVEEYDFFCVKCGFQVREKDGSSVLRTLPRSKSPSYVVFEPQSSEGPSVGSEPMSYHPEASTDSLRGNGWLLGLIFLATFLFFTFFLLIPVFLAFSGNTFSHGIHGFADFFANFGAAMGQFAGAIGTFFGNLGGQLGEFFGTLGSQLGSFFGNLGSRLGGFFGSLFDTWDGSHGMHMDVMLFPLSLTGIFIILGVLILIFSFAAHRRCHG